MRRNQSLCVIATVPVGTPPSVSSFLQRLGRSGRRSGTKGSTRILLERSSDHTRAHQDATVDVLLTLTAFLPLSGEGEFGAVQELLAFEQEHPEHRGALHVVPTWEVGA